MYIYNLQLGNCIFLLKHNIYKYSLQDNDKKISSNWTDEEIHKLPAVRPEAITVQQIQGMVRHFYVCECVHTLLQEHSVYAPPTQSQSQTIRTISTFVNLSDMENFLMSAPCVNRHMWEKLVISIFRDSLEHTQYVKGA